MSISQANSLIPELKKLMAYELTLLHPQDSPDAAARMIGEARIDPNPHQIEAALYGYQALQRGGAILADEVGLGKTIEAGLIINQYWSEGRRNILIVAPVALRAQWQKELENLFYLPSTVLSTDDWKRLSSAKKNPVVRGEPGIFIVSDHLIASNQKIFSSTHWDLVVIDEAHRLRNVYRKKKDQSVQAKKIRDAIVAAPKLLLTATPFQNSLEELYGLASIIDQSFFGSFESFQRLYGKPSKKEAFNVEALKERLKPIFRRTLRKDISHYLQYTERKPITVRHHYLDGSHEEQVHKDIARLLNAEYLLLNSKTSRGFFDLIYLKLLGSSPYALNPALLKMIARFFQGLVKRGADEKTVAEWIQTTKSIMADHPHWESHWGSLAQVTCKTEDVSFESIVSYLKSMQKEDNNEEEAAIIEFEEEWTDVNNAPPPPNDLTALSNPDNVKDQLNLIITNYFRTHRAHLTGRAKVFIETIKKHISEANSKGFNQKAVVFTEYVRTLHYIQDLLNKSDLKDFEIICYHGGLSNKKGADGLSERDKAIERFRNSDKAILIATEAGAEGLNLQFCNLLINYDLPWNPQRIEQRIGRCHRYGQKNDVIVINFVCEDNQAENHIFKLLSEKFKLFDGVFGASNSILGAIHAGIDIERLCADIYLGTRSFEQVDQELKVFLESSVDAREQGIREVAKKLLEEFDPGVTRILKIEWDKLKEEVTLNLTAQESKLAKLIISEIPGKFDNKKAVFSIDNQKYPVLSRRSHTFQRVYASEDLPLITTRHEDIAPLLEHLKQSPIKSAPSYYAKLSEELAKQVGKPHGVGYWIYAYLWRVVGATTFENLKLFLIGPDGKNITTTNIRQILDHITGSAPVPNLSPDDSIIAALIHNEEESISEHREAISQKIYSDRMLVKQRAKLEQEEAAEQIRLERRSVAADFDMQILKAPMKDKNRILKEKDTKLKVLDKELEIYQSTLKDLESQELTLHRELTKKHNSGSITATEIFKIHLTIQ